MAVDERRCCLQAPTTAGVRGGATRPNHPRGRRDEILRQLLARGKPSCAGVDPCNTATNVGPAFYAEQRDRILDTSHIGRGRRKGRAVAATYRARPEFASRVPGSNHDSSQIVTNDITGGTAKRCSSPC